MPTSSNTPSFFKGKRLSAARVHEISIVDDFKRGYRNREDITNLPAGVLVVGSQNVLVNTSSRIQARQGYSVDGTGSTVNAPILEAFDWNSKFNGERHVRFGFNTGNNGKLQYRYTDSTGGVFWNDLATGISSTGMNFATFWDTTEQIRTMLYVKGDNNINEWSGAYAQASTIASGSITLASSIASYGFFSTSAPKQKILANGTLFTYTTASGSTFSGMTPNPQSIVASGDVLVQAPYTYPLTSATGAPTYNLDLISTWQNQVFIGSKTSPTFYMSKTNNYGNFAQSSPRIPSDGFTANLDDNVVSFIPQENNMYITAGKNFIYNLTLTQSTSYNGASASSITTETAVVTPLKIAPQQAPKAQSAITKFKNYVAMITNEPTIDVLGRLENILGTPQTDNISDSIKLDMDTYDFANASIFYWRWYLLVAIPTAGIVRMYNFNTKAWEAPQTIPITRFFTVNGDLYGHSSTTSETYKLFTGYSDRVQNGIGQPILAQANFSYQNYGTRTTQKNGNEFYMEGYISPNTSLTGEINYDLDGCMTTQTFTVDGSDNQIVCVPSDESSFGKMSFGKEKFGGDKSASLTGLPPKFRVIKTFPRINFYEHQFSFNIYGKDQNFQLIAFGTNAATADDTNAQIKQ
jgi:hypothetical protein